jgi:flagellin
MASKNSQDGISLIQTAEGGMQEIDNMIQRIRELVVQSANDTNDFKTADRRKLQDEIDQLTQGIDAMANQVEFNAKKLINGELMDASTKAQLIADIDVKIMNAMALTLATGVSMAVSVVAGSVSAGSGTMGALLAQASSAAITTATSYSVSFQNGSSTATMALSAEANTNLSVVASSNFSSATNLMNYVGLIDDYVAKLQDAKKNGAAVDQLLSNLSVNRQAALDLYAAAEFMSAISSSRVAIAKVNGNGLWFQTGSNSMQGINVGVGKVTSDILGIGLGGGVSTVKVDKPNAIEISSQINIVDNALQYVTSQRAKLGAVQNRLEYTKSSLDISSENLSASESRIRDTDMAKEMMKLTAANVLQQAGVSMLSQANQSPQSVLQLLR